MRIDLQEFFHGVLADRIRFCLVELDHGFKVFRFLAVEFQNFDELLDHARGNLFAAENIGEVASGFGKPEPCADFGTAKRRLYKSPCALIFREILAKMRILKDVGQFFHFLNINKKSKIENVLIFKV